MKKLELTADQISVIIAALERFPEQNVKGWELDEIEAGEDKAEYIGELIEQLEKAGNR